MISENQGLERSRSTSSRWKISGPANLDFFSGLWKKSWVYTINLKKRIAEPDIFLGFEIELDLSRPWFSEIRVQIIRPIVTHTFFVCSSWQVVIILVIMHNKISLPVIAWSWKNREKGVLCFQERQKATSRIEIVWPYFLTTVLGPLLLWWMMVFISISIQTYSLKVAISKKGF